MLWCMVGIGARRMILHLLQRGSQQLRASTLPIFLAIPDRFGSNLYYNAPEHGRVTVAKLFMLEPHSPCLCNTMVTAGSWTPPHFRIALNEPLRPSGWEFNLPSSMQCLLLQCFSCIKLVVPSKLYASPLASSDLVEGHSCGCDLFAPCHVISVRKAWIVFIFVF